MEVTDSFIPTAGSVGLLPTVTYFFMLVALLAFAALFIATNAYHKHDTPEQRAHPKRLILTWLATASFVTGLIYYPIQLYYHNLLAELPAVSDATDRLTLIRESYNAIGQYRYMAWFITTPILLLLAVSPLRLRWDSSKRLLVRLFLASFFMVFTSYIGHQQLSFDNEIQAGPKVLWGGVSVLAYGYIVFTLYRLWKESDQIHPGFRTTAGLFAGTWGVYFLGYFCTLLSIDFNWIHLTYTLTDLISQVSIGLLAYLNGSKVPK